ncbi:MAG: ATP-binding protein [Methanobacterium sp.]|uniref:ATP-binding protein n=1 Tax=Methanobacterium sp. TaxID=2164 RepID=UPI003C7968CC
MLKSKILIVEDDAIESMDIKINLENMGYEVSAVISSGEEALPMISQHMPDLVLMDIILKGKMNGVEVAQKIKDEYDLPVIYLTSNSEEKTLEKAKLTEPFGYVIKPYDIVLLRYTIEIGLYKHKMEKKLESRLQYFKNVFDNAPIGIFHSTIEGKFIRVNKALSSMLGYSTQKELINEVNKLNVADKIYNSPEKRPEFISNAIKDDKWHSYKNEYIRKDGNIMIGELYFRSIRNTDGSIRYLEGFITDVTEQKELEEARMKTEMIAWDRLAEIDGIYDSSPIGLCTLDKDLRYIRINENLARINGFPAIKHIGKTPREIIPTISEKIESMAKKTLKTGRSIMGVEMEGITPSMPGVLRTWIVQSVPFKDIDGNVIGISFSVLEITEMKKAQKELFETVKKLKLSNEELQRFAYVVSHDFKEPLRMVLSFTQLLKSRYEGEFDNEADEFIGFIIEGSKRMERLLDDLLTYSRITTTEEKYSEIDLNKIIEDSIYPLKLIIEDNNVEITWDHMPTILINRTQMIHVFQNLITNAIKFRNNKTPKIHVSVKLERDQWIFGVSDNGIGIDPHYHKRIFEVFQRLHRRDEYDGTGMGLFLTKKIIEGHNGHIWVESEEGKGSTFYFTLPVENNNI